jgi:DNA-directed RNA polymerase subunit RPC12/RpoP
MFCSQCGTEISDNSNVCEHCGSPIISNTKRETSINNDRTIPKSETRQSMGKRVFIVLGIILLIVVCLLVFIFFFEKTKSNNQTPHVKTVIPTPPIKTVEPPKPPDETVEPSKPSSNLNDWVKYDVDEHGNVYSYKKVKIDKEGENYIVQVWDKLVYSDSGREKEIQDRIKDELPIEGYNKLSRGQVLYEIDCKEQRDKMLSIVTYDTDDKVLYSKDIDNKEWSHIEPDSHRDTILKGVCK